MTIDANLAQLSVKGATLLVLLTIFGNLFQLLGCAPNNARSSQLSLLNASLSGFFTRSDLDPTPCNSSFLCAQAVNKFVNQNEELALLWLPVSFCLVVVRWSNGQDRFSSLTFGAFNMACRGSMFHFSKIQVLWTAKSVCKGPTIRPSWSALQLRR